MVAVGCSCLTFNAAINASSASTLTLVDWAVVLMPTMYHGVMAFLLAGPRFIGLNVPIRQRLDPFKTNQRAHAMITSNAPPTTQPCPNERGRTTGVGVKLLLKAFASGL